MNTIVIAPEVLAFVASVRAELADLEADELLEITDGLEADLTDLVAEQGTEALGDPVAYARELRSAAGLAEAGAVRRTRLPVGALASGVLDAGHERFDALVARAPYDVTPLIAWARPLWWVLRAWLAVQIVQLAYGSNPWSGTTLIPKMDGFGATVLVLAIAVSVGVGLARTTIRDKGGLLARLVVLAVNVALLAMLPSVFSKVDTGADRYRAGSDSGFTRGYNQAYSEYGAQGGPGAAGNAGLYADGRWVSNIYPYDAAGHPLVGVQLYDQSGKAIDTVAANECVYDADQMPIDSTRVFYPWSDGAAQKKNVFPVPSRVVGPEVDDPDPTAFTGKNKPSVGGFPFVSVPKVSLPGLLTSVGKTPDKAFVPGPRTGPINPIDYGC